MLSPWLELTSHSQTHVLRHLPRLPPSDSAAIPHIQCWVCDSEGDFSFKWSLEQQPSRTETFLETLYWFPPGISLNRNACQQLAHEEGHYQFSISLKKYFGLSFEKSLFPDQRVLYLTKVPKPIWLLVVRTQTPDYTESGPSASVTWGWRANCALGWSSVSCFFYSMKKTPLALSPFLVTFVPSSLTLRTFVVLIKCEPTL